MTKIQRFYDAFQPDNYTLYLDVNRQAKQFSGTTTITGSVQSTAVALHQKNLNVTNVQIDGVSVAYTTDDDSIQLQNVQLGKHAITVEYHADLTDTMMGMYPSYYEVDGEKKQIIGTQFETTFARQVFPGIDEPEAKATFDLAIKFDEHPGETIISNMPETRENQGVHYFDTTVKMSTYLVAFAFGELQSKLTKTTSGVQVGVFATKAHASKELDFALDIAKRSIEFYEDFYQTPYPLPHSWQLALPDFSAGAMENWGLVTYREAYLLLDPDNSSLDHKQVVATVIAHELAHQWFGDLVTMKWWDDLWLNESFANMMEYVAIDAIEPDWHIWETFQTSDVPAALQRDATDGVQSVHVEVNNPAEIDALFDGAIVYAKGARMLVMVRALIGDEALRTGLKAYFATHKYGNATGADLWQALGDASELDIGTIMHSWLEQPGYPVVTAQIIDGNLTLKQTQFFVGDGENQNRKWQIPLNSNYAQVPEIMTDEQIVVGNYADLRAENGSAFRLNAGNNSHFITQYYEQLFADVLAESGNLDSITQLQLLQDARLLADGGQNSYANLVPLLSRFADSQSNIVNAAVYSVAGNLRKFVTPESTQEANLRKLYDQLSGAQVQRLGWTPKAHESNENRLTRAYVLSASLYAKNPGSIEEAHQIFDRNQKWLGELIADIRGLVMTNEVRNYGSQALFDQLLDEHRQSADASFKADVRSALTSTTDPQLISQLVGFFENADVIKPQDLRGWFRGLLANEAGQQAAWDWIRNDWDWLERTVGGDMEFATYITVIAGIFRTSDRLDEFKAFFEPKVNTPGLTREIQMDTRVIESRVALIESQKDAVNAAISEALK